MPGPYGRERPESAFAGWLLVAILGAGMMAFGTNQTLGFAFAFIGGIAAIFAWQDVKRARRAEQRRARRAIQPPR
jgi:hypothetical protein